MTAKHAPETPITNAAMNRAFNGTGAGLAHRLAEHLHVCCTRLERDRARLIEALRELCDLVEDTLDGAYKPDHFTTQPSRDLLRELGEGETS